MHYHKKWWYTNKERKKRERHYQFKLAHSTKNICIRPNIHRFTADLNHHKNISNNTMKFMILIIRN